MAQWISSPASVRDMTERLKNEHGIEVSHMTIARDLAAIRAAGMAMDRDFALCMEGDPMEHALESSVKEAKRNGESERKRAAAGVVALGRSGAFAALTSRQSERTG